MWLIFGTANEIASFIISPCEPASLSSLYIADYSNPSSLFFFALLAMYMLNHCPAVSVYVTQWLLITISSSVILRIKKQQKREAQICNYFII